MLPSIYFGGESFGKLFNLKTPKVHTDTHIHIYTYIDKPLPFAPVCARVSGVTLVGSSAKGLESSKTLGERWSFTVARI